MSKKHAPLNTEELLKMRESGMANSDIARVMNCSYSAVLKAIGKQPSSMREYNNTYQPVISCDFGTMEKPAQIKVEAPRKEPQVSLMVENHDIRLSGLFASYHINTKNSLLEVIDGINDNGQHVALAISTEQLKTFITELQTIDRKIAGFKPGDEMW